MLAARVATVVAQHLWSLWWRNTCVCCNIAPRAIVRVVVASMRAAALITLSHPAAGRPPVVRAMARGAWQWRSRAAAVEGAMDSEITLYWQRRSTTYVQDTSGTIHYLYGSLPVGASTRRSGYP